ncbi:mucin-3A-like [Rhinophrynus dorsalis]
MKCICEGNYYGDRCQFEDDRCQNGGSFSGFSCICSPGFTGSICEFAEESTVIDKIDASVNVQVKISNENFTESLLNNASDDYKNFVQRFKQQMVAVYRDIPGFKDIKITEIRHGSIVVIHEVIVEIPYKQNVSEDYNEIIQNIFQTVNDSVHSTGSCTDTQLFCFEPGFTDVTGDEPNTDPSEICNKRYPDHSQYYYARANETQVSCLSNCTKGEPGEINCNYGKCLVERAGPTCLCRDDAMFWYSGKQCSGRISRPGVIGGVTAVASVIVIIAVTLVVLRRRKDKYSDDNQSVINDWDNEDQWFSPKSTILQKVDGSDGNKFCRDLFKTDLQLVDTSMKINIKRPQIVKS